MKAFYTRRILRIWPLYLFFIIFCYSIGFWWPSHQTDGRRIIAMLFMAGNWYAIVHGYGTQSPLSPLWSISVEEQFYVVWPTIARFGRKFIAASAVVASFISLISISWICLTDWTSQAALWANSVAQFLFFAIGALLACFLDGRDVTKSKGRAILFISLGLIGFFLIERYLYLKDDLIVHPNPIGFSAGYLLVGIMCVVIFIGFRSIPTVPASIAYLGKISYGLYVFHALSMFVGGEIATAIHLKPLGRFIAPLITICLAALSYQYLEKPFLRLKERFAFIRSRPA